MMWESIENEKCERKLFFLFFVSMSGQREPATIINRAVGRRWHLLVALHSQLEQPWGCCSWAIWFAVLVFESPISMHFGNRRRHEPTPFMTDIESQVELVNNPCQESTPNAELQSPLVRQQVPPQPYDLATLVFRPIAPRDRQIIERLHEEWFPVSYQSDFYDELVQGRMVHSGEPLYTNLATTGTNDSIIVGCVIGSMVNALLLSRVTQELLINDLHRYPRLFYIMTLGTLPPYRRSGLATRLIQDSLIQARKDRGCGAAYLHVMVDNRAAIAMYEKLGFSRVQEIQNYYSIGDDLYNCYLYAKFFHGAYFLLPLSITVVR